MRFLRSVCGLLVLVFSVMCAAPALAQESQSRFAFVVGNDGYEGAPLPTAANDAALVADALKAAKFDITGARNLDQDTLRASYREFLAKVAAAGPGAVSVVYVSGYGLQFDGENYLVPPGAAIARDADVSLNAIRLSDLIRPLSGAPGRGRVVLLDLSYASPFAKQISGLAPGLAIVEPEAGTIVGFNAAPGVWANPGKEPYGPYAQALSEMLREPGLPIEEVLTRVRTRTAELTRAEQLPWSAGKIEPPLLLLERAPNAPPPAVAPDQLAAERAKPIDKMPVATAYAAAIDRDSVKAYEDFVAAYPQSPYTKNVQGIIAARREARTWRRTLDLNTQNAYWSYLKRYPRGPHASDARRRLARLQAAVEPPPVFDAVAYDDPPPPPVELAYFDGPDVVYYDPGVPPLPPSLFVAAPPPWYQPPPPPVFDDDADFFLPEIVAAVTAPAWIAPPPYVLPPPTPYMLEAAARPPGWRPYVAIPAALAVGLAAGKLSNNYLQNRRQSLGQATGPRQAVMPAIAAQPRGANLPAGVRPGQTFVRPATLGGQQPARPGAGLPATGQGMPGAGLPGGATRPNNALPNLPAGGGARPAQQPSGLATPLGANQPAGSPAPQQGARPGLGAGPAQGGVGAGAARPAGQTNPQLIQQQQRRQQLQQQQQQRALEQQQRVQQQQQQRAQQMQLRRQQMQEQRSRQLQQQQQRALQQQQRQQQLQQQRSQQQQQLLRQQQMMQQQRSQQMQIQQQRQQQMLMQQRAQQQRQQQMQMQQQRQQQMIMQQRQQQLMMQQQRQQQMQQRQQPAQRRPCGLPGLPRC